MQNTKLSEDSFYVSFGPGEYQKLKDAQLELEQNTSWETSVSHMSIEPMDEPMTAQQQFSEPDNNIPMDVLMDTVENCGLMLVYDGRTECMRDCAIPSLLSTIDLRGNGIYRAEKINQATGLSAFLKDCRKSSKVMMRAGKVSAVVSQKYEIMQTSELLDIADHLDAYLGTPEFLSGCVSHSQTVAKFQYPEIADEITDTYRSVLAAHGKNMKPGEKIMPLIEFRTSDTTNDAAKLLPYLQLSPGHLMPIGLGVRVNHIAPYEFDENNVRKTATKKFEEEAQMLYSKMDYDIKSIVPAMLETPIDYPANSFIGLCKRIQVPQKWGGSVEEEIRNDWPDGSGCSFLDVYEYLTSITKKAIEETTPHSNSLLKLEEGIARIANNPSLWKKYDLPGTVSWAQELA